MHRNMEKQALCTFSLYLSFMMCIFAPFEFYLSNKDFFFFSGTDMLEATLILFCLCFFVSITFNTVILKRVTYGYYILAIQFGLSLAMYLQGNFFIVNYGTMDGTHVDWNNYKLQGLFSVLLFIVAITLSVLFFRRYGKIKLCRLVSIVTICIFLIQLTTLAILYVDNNGLKKEARYIATTEGEFTYSPDSKNVIVLLLDSFESTDLSGLIEENSANRDILKDFTYYPNTIGSYSFTNLSVPHMLTGELYKNEMTYGEYLKSAYINSSLFNVLEDKNWNIGVYSEVYFPNDPISLRIDNCRLVNENVSSKRRLMGYMYRFVGFRYSPQFLKKYFEFYPDEMYSEIGSTKEECELYGSSNITFKDSIENIKQSEQIGDNFKFIHLNGAHVPYYLTEDATMSNEETSVVETGKGLLHIVDCYLNKLREVGVYDNSTIVICADHGTNLRYAPVFMVKNSMSNHDFEISEKAFSYMDLPEVLTNFVCGCDIDNYLEKQNRLFYSYDSKHMEYDLYCNTITEMKVTGDFPADYEIVKTGNIFETGNLD